MSANAVFQLPERTRPRLFFYTFNTIRHAATKDGGGGVTHAQGFLNDEGYRLAINTREFYVGDEINEAITSLEESADTPKVRMTLSPVSGRQESIEAFMMLMAAVMMPTT